MTSQGILAVLLVSLATVSHAFRTQSASVEGQLLCGAAPATNVHIKLLDQDDGPDPDDVMDTTTTDANGKFKLSGSTMELTPIEPEIRIYHDCYDHGRPCQREWVIKIPSDYISSGDTPTKTMNLGVMNLEIELESESHDCIH